MNKFPLTLEAVKKSDGVQWAIGDALLAECGPPGEPHIKTGSYGRIQDAAQYLKNEGYEGYSFKSLLQFRDVAYAFRDTAKRSVKLAWGTHRAAITPEYLQAIIAGAPEGTKITQPYIQGIRSAQQADARAEREAAEEAAREEREKAEKAEAEARAKAQAAEASEKAEAEAKLEKAKKKTAKAKATEKEVKTAPKKKLVAPAKEEQSDLSLRSKFIANAMHSISLAQKSAKDLENYISELSPTSVRALTDCALEAANAWTDAANLVRGVTKNHSGHLSVVGE